MTTEFGSVSKSSTLPCKEDYLFDNEVSIRNEYMRFACMFYSFTLFAFVTTILLFLSAYNFYHNESESTQHRFIPYSVLGTISLVLFFVFFIGSLAYTSKLIKKLRLKKTFNQAKPLTYSMENLNQTTTEQKSIESFTMNADKSHYTSTKDLAQQKFQTLNISYHACQTDV
ncbi:unnamed protein product [Rotaria magnacalcarata]|uniref:Uncharacterized protein n=1 Tax=Rotaria magnacalcarata TaxID=392030 RepID=A0A818YQ56_9BILA|nr:unnamed protein product [Rotaria magnacalcarata]CAF3757866.1 unnamed protein product [Rotaria magnacalcarata]